MAILPTGLASMFGGRSAPLLGLDFGTSSVRVVALGRSMSGKWSLECCGSERLQPGWVVSDNIEKFGEVAQAIKRLLKKSGAKTKNVAMALPASAVMTRRIMVQNDLSESDFESQVEAEVSPYLPWPLEEANIDYAVLGPNHSETEVEVLVAAAKQVKVEERQALMEAAGLKLVALDLEPYVRARAASYVHGELNKASGPRSSQLTAIFDMGSVSTSMLVARGEDVVFDRDLSFGGAQLTDLIERTYKLSPTDAERQKRSRDLPSGFENQVLSPYIANLAVEVERGIQAFHANSTQRITSVLLTGGGACLSGLPKAVSAQTGLACTPANPFSRLEIKNDALKRRLSREAPSYTTAVGLALRRLGS